MARQQWLEQLAQKLAEHDVPARCQQRLLEELRDHWSDITDEENRMSTELETTARRMGNPTLIAGVAAATYRRPGFLGRHPLLTFILGPLPVVILTAVLFALAIVAAAWVTGIAAELDNREPGTQISPAALTLLATFQHGIRFVPFVVAALFFAWLGMRTGVRGRWCLAACTLIGLVAGAFVVTLAVPTDGGPGSLSIGFGIPFSVLQIVQMSLPLAIGILGAMLTYRRGRRLLAD